MTRIKVDPEKLERLSRQLDLLRSEFDGIENRVEQYEEAVGRSGKLTEALDDVAGNWSKKREEVLTELSGLAQLALDAARFYEERERKLASDLGGAKGTGT